MIENISIDFPSWFLLFPLLCGLVFTSILYVLNKKSKLKRNTTIFLFLIRFISITLISALLLKPYVKTNKKHYQKPNLVLAIDNSKSMLQNTDSTFVKDKINSLSENLKDKYGSQYEIINLTFGSKISFKKPDFNDSYSNYSELIQFLNNQYANAYNNIIVMLGDGIYNLGNNPLYDLNNLKIISIASGDTVEKPDIRISDISYNPVNYLNDGTPFIISLNSNTSKHEKFNLNVYRNKKLIEKKTVTFNNNENSKIINFNFTEKKAGKKHYRFQLTGANDTIKQNNHRDVYINVLDEKNKILILANSPHPDISTIKETLLNNKNFDLELKFANDKNINLSKYSLVILHQLPSKKYPLNKLLNDIKALSINTWFIVGKQTNTIVLRNYFNLSGINSSGLSYDNTFARKNTNFSIFKLSQTEDFLINELPPLEVPLLNYGDISDNDIIFYQNINGIETDFPLMYFFNQNSSKVCMLMGTGIWKWRLFNFKQSKNFDFTNELINKTAHYLSIKTNNKQFYIEYNSQYQSPGKISLKAFLYNKSFELIKNAEINFSMKDENNNTYNYIFTSGSNEYNLILENLEPGNYTFNASINYKGTNFVENGQFTVIKNELENFGFKADYKLMYDIANNTNAKFFTLNETDSLYKYIEEINLPKKVSYTSKYQSLNDFLSILGLILFLLSIEWFVRRYAGSY